MSLVPKYNSTTTVLSFSCVMAEHRYVDWLMLKEIFIFSLCLWGIVCVKKMQNVHIYFITNRFNIFCIFTFFTTERGIKINWNNLKERHFTTNKCKKKEKQEKWFYPDWFCVCKLHRFNGSCSGVLCFGTSSYCVCDVLPFQPQKVSNWPDCIPILDNLLK